MTEFVDLILNFVTFYMAIRDPRSRMDLMVLFGMGTLNRLEYNSCTCSSAQARVTIPNNRSWTAALCKFTLHIRHRGTLEGKKL